MSDVIPLSFSKLANENCPSRARVSEPVKVTLLLSPYQGTSTRIYNWLESADHPVMACCSLEHACDWLVEHEDFFSSVVIHMETPDPEWLLRLSGGMEVIDLQLPLILVAPFPVLHELEGNAKLAEAMRHWRVVAPVNRFVLEALPKRLVPSSAEAGRGQSPGVAPAVPYAVHDNGKSDAHSDSVTEVLPLPAGTPFRVVDFAVVSLGAVLGGFVGTAYSGFHEMHAFPELYVLGATVGGSLSFAIVRKGHGVITSVVERWL